MLLRQHLLRSLILTAAIANVPLLAADATTQPATAAANLPVTNVTLFSSGVGYFEHAGSVTGDGVATLKFKTAQINDVLKSLVLQDLGGGSVSAVQYPSQDPVEKTLKSFGVDITNNPPLAALLNQLRGAKVTLETSGQLMHGVVLGCEKRSVPGAAQSPAIESWVLNLIDGAEIRQIELNKIANIKLDDPGLKDELAQALQALSQSRDQDKKDVTIKFSGAGDHKLRLGYVVESPVWKASYRLIIPSVDNQDKATKPKLQGWAIVENQTDSDWNNIRLSLVSGRPISFMMDLYRPMYNPRPTMQLNLLQSLRPQTYGAGVRDEKQLSEADRPALETPALRSLVRAQKASAAPMAADMGARFGMTGGSSNESESSPMNATSSVAALASAAQLGELFQYSIDDVSLKRQSSAMIPIVSDDISVEKLSIFNPSVLPRNPLNGAMVTNTTTKHLLQGPITVFEDGYAGDAQIENLPPGQKRLLSYGVDLRTTINTEASGVNNIVGGKIVKGVMYINRRLQSSMTYTIDNKADKDKTLIIEEPLQPEWTLLDTPEPLEKTDTLYRFKVALAKSKVTTFKASKQHVEAETLVLVDCAPDQLLAYTREGGIPQKVRDAIAGAITRRQAYEDFNRQVDEKDKEIKAIGDEQTRLRENLRTVDRTTPYANRILAKLNEQETQIEKLQTERDALQKQNRQAKQEYLNYLQNLNIE